MRRIAMPLFAGVLTSGATVLIIFPVLYYAWKSYKLPGGGLLRGFDPADPSAYADA
jgi:hypothetical protein